MKTLTGIAMIFLLGAAANAQQSTSVGGFSLSSDKTVKNSPFSADAVSESVQTLADGNRIVHNSTSKLYRNSEGRSRRETSNGSGGLFGAYYSFSPSVTILDPVGGNKYLLDERLKTAEHALLSASANLKAISETYQVQSDEYKRVLELAKVGTTGSSAAGVTYSRSGDGQLLTGALTATGSGHSVAIPSVNGQAIAGTVSMAGAGQAGVFSSGGFAFTSPVSKYESKTDQLGTQNIEGVEAEGTRTTTTIPAGAIGNERPIEIVYERWYSKELQLVVMSKSSDPRTGEQTYRLTNIVRSEPDPSLFKVPSSYRIVTQPTPAAKATAVRAEVERSAIPVKATASTAPVPAAKGRPQ